MKKEADLSGYRRKGKTVIGYKAPCADISAWGQRKEREISWLRAAWLRGRSAAKLAKRMRADIRAWREGKMDGTWEPKEIRNRDIPKLTRVLYAMQDVSMTEQKRMWQQDRLWNMTARLTGMPGGGGDPKGLDANFADICEIEERYERECAEYLAELKEAERILNGIRHGKLRTFVAMKYVMGMRRRDILKELNLRRWQYEEICERIEMAENMEHVQWPEKYVLMG